MWWNTYMHMHFENHALDALCVKGKQASDDKCHWYFYSLSNKILKKKEICKLFGCVNYTHLAVGESILIW